MALWYRNVQPARTPAPPIVPPISETATAHPFKGWTESLYIAGTVHSEDRLSDILNRREPIRVLGGIVVPTGAPLTAACIQHEFVLDPFDFDFVLGRAPHERTVDSQAAKRIHKVRYPVLVEGTNFEIRGTLHVFPGISPESVIHHTGTLFLPVTNPSVRREGRVVTDPGAEVALVNRYAVRRIHLLDSLH